MIPQTLKLFTFSVLAATAALGAAPTPTRQIVVDSSGNPTSPLNLSSSKISGVLLPSRLGSGVPTNLTVLRGDGTWGRIGISPGTVAAGDDARIVGAVQSIPTMAALRALPAPTAQRCIVLQGYYAAGDKSPRYYDWDAVNAQADDGGWIIKPAGVTGGGAWVMRWDRHVANVLDWGAKGDGDATFDSLPAIMAAQGALTPYIAYSAIAATPSRRTPPAVTGTLLFPGTILGYSVSDEIIFSYFVSVVSDSGYAPTVGFMANTAPGTLAYTKYVFRQCPLAADTASLNNEFNTTAINVSAAPYPARNNPKSGGWLLYTSEGSHLDKISVAGYGVEGIHVFSQRGCAGYLSSDGRGCQGPGVVIDGEGFECGMISAGLAYSNPDGSFNPANGTDGRPLGACVINCLHAHIGTLNVEGSPMGVTVTADNVSVGICFGNAMGQLVNVRNCANPSFPVMRSRASADGTKPIFTFNGTSYGVHRSVSIPNDGSGRASYVDTLQVGDLSAGGSLYVLPRPAGATVVPPAAGGGFYVDSNGDLHFLHSNGTDHVISSH